jgi:patatin-related protein
MAVAMSPQEQGGDDEEREQLEPGSDRQQIRLALVMNGGVSLAIWMGGVTVEVNRLIEGDSIYGEVLDLLRSEVRVDVIAGASAGGINGAMLAAMISHQNDRANELDNLRRIWIEDGSLGRMFRPPMQKKPPSLMKGDEFFLPRLQQVFEDLTSGEPTPAETSPIRLTLTTTLLKAMTRGFADDFGSLIVDADHRGEFTFRRGAGLPDDFDKREDGQIANRLALASRCTASFPGAFEPSFVPIGRSEEDAQRDPDRPDMKGYANFSSSRFCADGGALVNKPFRPAIRGIFAQPASDEQIRRVLAYVVPDPDLPGADSAQKWDEPQTIGDVVLKSAVTLPRAESVSRELEDIAEHNRKVRAQRLLREQLLGPEDGSGVGVEAVAARLFPAFRSLRAQAIVDRLTTWADPFEGRFDGLGKSPWNTGELARTLLDEPEPWLPVGFAEQAQLGREPWTWGNDTIETIGGIALALVGTGLRIAEQEVRATLAEARENLHARLRELRLGCLRPEPSFWRDQSLATQEYWKARGDGTDANHAPVWERQSFEDWRDRSETARAQADEVGGARPAGIAHQIAESLVIAAPTLRQIAENAASDAGQELVAAVEALVPSSGADPIEASLRRLLAQAIVQTVTAAGKPPLDQLVELLQLSSNVPNGFDERTRGEQKVAGRQLGHFGAFYKRSWRANDWMWGRLDGAARLAQMIVDPARLAQLDLSREEAFAELKKIALGPEEDEAYEVLADESLHGWQDDAAERELTFLDPDPAGRRATPPESLPVCARAIARRIQLRILQEELTGVADAVRFDLDEGGQRGPAVDFLAAVRNGQYAEPRDGVTIGPREASRLLGQCRVGEEKISSEMGSDLFTSTVTTAAAIGITAVSGSASGLPKIGRAFIGMLRTPIIWLWILAKNAVSTHRTGFALLVLLLAAGGALIAVSALGNVTLPGFLAGLGTIILLSGAAVALIRSKTRGVWVILFALAVAVLLLWLPSVLVKALIDTDATGVASWVRRAVPPAAAVIGFVLGGMILGLVTVRAPRSERELPGRRETPSSPRELR